MSWKKLFSFQARALLVTSFAVEGGCTGKRNLEKNRGNEDKPGWHRDINDIVCAQEKPLVRKGKERGILEQSVKCPCFRLRDDWCKGMENVKSPSNYLL